MAGLLPQGIRGVAADALAAVEAERVTLRALEQAAEDWDTLQGFVSSDPLSAINPDPDLKGAAPDASPLVGGPSPPREPLGPRHLSAALARVKARTATEVGAPQASVGTSVEVGGGRPHTGTVLLSSWGADQSGD